MLTRRRVAVALLGCGVLAGVTACSGGGTVTTTQLDRDCATVVGAAARLRLIDPLTANPAQVRGAGLAAGHLRDAAGGVQTALLRVPAVRAAGSAALFAAALQAHASERAVGLEAVLRRRAVPIARICGLSPSSLFGQASAGRR